MHDKNAPAKYNRMALVPFVPFYTPFPDPTLNNEICGWDNGE